MSIPESKATFCPKCKKPATDGLQFCPSCGSSLEFGNPRKAEDLGKNLGCLEYSLIGIIFPLLPVFIILLFAKTNIFTQNALAVFAILVSIFYYPTIWFFATRGWYNKVNFYGYINVLLLSFVPLLNWWVVYYLGKGLYMTYTKQELRNPPKATKIGFVILLVAIGLSVVINIFSMQSSPSPMPPSPQASAVVKRATYTPRPTQRPTTPTSTAKPQLSYKNMTCISWEKVDRTDLNSQICVYGKVYSYGPYSDKWSSIQFSEKSDSFRVIDFNYYYSSPLRVGDCVIVYGKIRDYGSYLMITPDKDAADSIRIGSSILCN